MHTHTHCESTRNTHTHTRTDTHTPEDDKAEKGRQMLNQFTAKLTRTRIRAEIVDSSQNLNKQQIKGKCRRQTCSTDFLVGADVARLVHVRPAAIHLVYCVRTARSDCRYTTTLRRQRNMAAARVRTSPCPVETGPCVCVSSCEFCGRTRIADGFFLPAENAAAMEGIRPTSKRRHSTVSMLFRCPRCQSYDKPDFLMSNISRTTSTIFR